MCPQCGRVFNPVDIKRCPDDGAELNPLTTDRMIGEVIDGKYRILEVVGAGGMSLVFKAEHLLLNRIVAVKMLHAYLRSDDVSVKRFQQEARTCASFDHPNVVPILDFGVTKNGQPFLVMKFLDGTSLAHMLRERRRLPWMEAVPIFIQCCDALEAAHHAGIIHRDIKPGNIVIIKDPDGSERVQVVDFGIAKMLRDDLNDQTLTQAGEVFGSPLYMSPEQCEGRALDARSDIYSLGAVIYETISGQPPLMGSSATETMRLHTRERPRPFSQVVEGLSLPDGLEQVVQTMLAKSPSARFHTMAAVRRKLKDVMNDLPESRTGRMPRFTNRIAVVAVSLSLVMILTLIYLQGIPLLRNYRVHQIIVAAENDIVNGKAAGASKELTTALEIARNIKDHGATQSRVLSLLASAYEKQGLAQKADVVEKQRELLIKREIQQQYGSAGLRGFADAVETASVVKVDRSNKQYYRNRVSDLETASMLMLDTNDVSRAEKLARTAMDIQHTVFGVDDPDSARVERQLGKVFLDARDFKVANDCFSRAMKEAEKHPNPTKKQVIEYARIGEEFAKRQMYDVSVRNYLASINLAERDLPKDDPCVPAIMRSFARVLEADRKEALARTIRERAEVREQQAQECQKPSQKI